MSAVCRICLETSSEEALISPCKCKGSQQYVHAACLDNWQETVMDTMLTRPNSMSFSRLARCSTCKAPYNYVQKSSNSVYFSSHFIYVWDEYKYQRYGAFALFLVLLWFLDWYWVLSIFGLIFCVICYFAALRPQINKTFKGYRVGLIRIGRPVEGLQKGILLQATEQISKGIFAQSKILLTEYSRQKAIGFIVNKGMSIREKNIKFGGPVKISVVHNIHNDPCVEGSQHIVEEIYYGGRIIDGQSEENVKVLNVNGHAEWKPLQLDGEIRSGAWRVLGLATSSDVFSN